MTIFTECLPPQEAWISFGGKLAISTLMILIGTQVIRRGIKALSPILARKHNYWGKALVKAAPQPLVAILWLHSIAYALDAACLFVGFTDPLSFIDMIQQGGTVAFVTWLVLRWKQGVEGHLKKQLKERAETAVQKATIDSIGRFLTIFIYVLSGLTILPILGASTTAILAWGSAGVFGATLAAQTIIANLFGGVMIHLTRPFAVGDWIQSPDKHLEGTVQEIGWYMTQILSFEKRPIYVPNSLFTSMVLVNPSRMSARQIKKDIGVRYDDFAKVPAIVSDVERYLKENPEINQDLSLMVHFTEYGAYSLNFNIYCFTNTTNWAEWRRVQGEVLHKVGQIITSHGAEIAFPTNVVKLEKEPQPMNQ